MRSTLLPTSFLVSTFVLTSIGMTSLDAQRGTAPPIRIPFAPPDLLVTVNAPAQVLQRGTGVVTVTIDNTLTTIPASTPFGSTLGGSAVTGVAVEVHFAGLMAVAVQGDSGLQCGLTSYGLVATCTGGAVPGGGKATITVSVKETGNCSYYCGPVYTDATVDVSNAISERLETNNRAVGATDVTGCLN